MTESRRFTEVERRLLDALLAGDHPVLHALRRQARVATTNDRFFSGGGVDIEIHVPRAEPAVQPAAFTLSDVAFELKGTEKGGQALLFVRDGFLQRLTLSNWTADWPPNPQIGAVHYLTPVADGEQTLAETRDMEGLARELAA